MRRSGFIFLLLLLLSLPVLARLGGGGSYSSSRSSSSSSRSSSSSYSRSSGGGSYSSHGDTSLGSLIPFIVVGLLYFIYAQLPQKHDAGGLLLPVGAKYLTVKYGQDDVTPQPSHPASPRALERIRAADANFSEPAFKAFANLLFSRLHNARGGNLPSLSGYVEPKVRQALEPAPPVSNVVVGASRYLMDSSAPSGWISLDVEFEATYTGPEFDNYTVERWTFARRAGTLSKDPDTLLKLGCPNCGNSGQLSPQGQCPFCEQIVTNGAFNWRVVRRTVVEIVRKPPIVLERGGGAEAGTDLPTVYQRDFDSQRRAFLARHPEFVWADFTQRVQAIFLALQAAWSELDFDKARPYETDTLYDTHRFWIERYREQGLQNRLEDVEITRVDACRYDHDAFYDIITVRIFASMKDFTVDTTGAVLSGSATQRRAFSEYWTFIRRVGAKSAAVQTDISSCPNCGAELNISQTGICEYCQAKVTSGEFDWILSSIDQDESYTVG